MRYLDRIAALAGISLAACGGGTVAPDLTPAAVAEATKTLEAAKGAVANAYAASRTVAGLPPGETRWPAYNFPSTANAPIPTTPPPNAKYVKAVFYNGGRPDMASVVVTMTGTSNSTVDGMFLGMFAIGQIDGTVRWQCGTAVAATALSSGAQTAMYPYLPEYCQN